MSDLTNNTINNNWDENELEVDEDLVENIIDETSDAIPTKVEDDDGKFQIVDYSEALEIASKKQKITLPIMTKYEKAKVIGFRATQIAKGAKVLVNVSGLKDPFEKAEKELLEKKTPFIIRRTLPDGSHEDWKMEEFLF
jgi:DNA-directed RNA polymerase I, II, and III subunit RPABC2